MSKALDIKHLKDGTLRVRSNDVEAIERYHFWLKEAGYKNYDVLHERTGFFSIFYKYIFEINYKKVRP